MKTWLLICCAVALALSAVHAGAQETGDDWEFAEDAASGATVAMVRYDGGQAIVAQCQQGRLVLLMTGLPAGDDMLRLGARRSDGRAAAQIWAPVSAPGAYRSASPGREARFMRGGGAFVVRSAADSPTMVNATFDLPAQSANLDRVLTACGWALEDDRDLLEEADVTLDPPGRNGRPAYRLPSVPEREVSCIVRDLRLRDCRADHPPSERTDNTRSLKRAVEGEQVHVPIGAAPASAEGRVFHVVASNQLLVMVNR